jgi:uncharacterized protein YecE (DUF72 family)
MMLAGSVLDRPPGNKYTAKLRFAELSLRAPLPRAPTLKRMRYALPEGFVVALRAPKNALVSARGPLRFDAKLEEGLAWLLAAREALAAKLVVLPTPADFTPGQRDRDLLAEFAKRLPRDAGRHWVWAPSGPWEVEDAEKVAATLGLVLAFDPLQQPLPMAKVVYAQLRTIGARQSFSESLLGDVSALLTSETLTESYVAIDAPRSFGDAVRLQKMADADDSTDESDPESDDDSDEDFDDDSDQESDDDEE